MVLMFVCFLIWGKSSIMGMLDFFGHITIHMNSIPGYIWLGKKKEKEPIHNLPKGSEPLHVSGISVKVIPIMAKGVGGVKTGHFGTVHGTAGRGMAVVCV